MQHPEASYNWNNLLKKDVIDFLEEFKSSFHWQEGEKVMELGCGTGDITDTVLLPFLPMSSVLVGCEDIKETVDYCSTFKARDRISYKLLDIQCQDPGADWEWETYDKIFSFYYLNWINDYSHAVVNLYSLLKFNGQILLLILLPDNPINIAFQQLNTSLKWKRFFKNLKWFYKVLQNDPVSFIESKLSFAGFEEVKCSLRVRNCQFQSWEAFMELVKAVNPYTRLVPDELLSECLSEVSEILKQQAHIQEDSTTGAVTMEYNIIVAMAQKCQIYD